MNIWEDSNNIPKQGEDGYFYHSLEDKEHVIKIVKQYLKEVKEEYNSGKRGLKQDIERYEKHFKDKDEPEFEWEIAVDDVKKSMK